MSTTARFPFSTFFILFLFLNGCNVSSQSKIPGTWEQGMKLTMSYGGGMRHYSYDLVINDTSSIYTENDGGKISTTVLSLTNNDLNNLLAHLRKHHFDKLKTEKKGPIYDKGTETISLYWKDQHTSISDGSMYVIAEKSQSDYNAISKYISELIQKNKAAK